MQTLIVNMLLLVLINSLITLVLKRKGYKFDCLGCGITAFCGAVPADPMTLKMIMMYNMERGEDSTGWVVNNVVTKDTEKVAKFLQQNTLVISETDENFTFIGHARKSSSGSRLNKELAHPFSIYREGVEKERPDLILAMNGTLINTEAVAEEFGIDYKINLNSDTQVMSKAMAKLGEKEYIRVIEGYEGTATLVFFTPKHANTLIVYKDPQRSLFGWQKTKDELYISSIDEPLISVGANKSDIFSFEDGFLFKINKGKITKKEKVERSPIKLKAKYTKRSTFATYSNYQPNNSINSRLALYEANTSIEDFDSTSIPITGAKNPHKGRGNKAYVVIDKYYKNGHEMQGKYWISKDGEVVDSTNMTGRPYYFVYGYMCKNEVSYNCLVELSNPKKDDFSLKNFKELRLSTIINNFEYPIITLVGGKEKWLVPKHVGDKFHGKGSKYEMEMSFHSMKYTLVYTGEWTKTTEVDICNLSEVKEKTLIINIKPIVEIINDNISIVDINKRMPLLEQMKYLRDLIKMENSNSSNFFYTRLRSDIYKTNPNPTIRQHFYISLLRLFMDDGFLSKEENKALIERGRVCEYCENDFINSVNTYLTKYYTFLKTSDKDKIPQPPLKETKNNTEILRGLSSDQKVLQLDKSYNNLSTAEVITSIQSANSVYNKKTFQEDVFDIKYENFDTFVIDWCNTDKYEDMFATLEATMLCFNTLGQITDDEFLEWYSLDHIDRRLKVRELFINWVATFAEKANNVVSEANNIIKKASDSSIIKEQENIVVEENWTPEEFETETRGNMVTMVDGMKDYYSDMAAVDPELQTDYVKDCMTELTFTISFLERKLLKQNPIKNDRD